MQRRQLGNGSAVSGWDAPNAPCIEALWRKPELRPQHRAPEGLDDRVVCMEFGSHAALYQQPVYISRGQSFIGRFAAMMHKRGVANDPEFGARLRKLIPLAGYKNPRRFAIDGMGWPEDGGPQKLNNYLKGRIPDVETLLQIADTLRVSVSDLLGLHDINAAPDEGWRDILQHLLELEGIPADKADTIASVSLAAQRLFRAFPEEEPLSTRARYAARAAWIQRQPLKTGT